MLSQKSNPFATKFIRAGALRYRFPDGQSINDIHDRLARNRWRGQVVGHHGSGKTTLLRTLDRHWVRWNRQPFTFSLQDGQRTFNMQGWTHWSSGTQIIIDGYEQLSWFSRCKLLYRCRRRESGLIVTTHHQALFLPITACCAATLTLATALVEELTSTHKPIDQTLVKTCFEMNRGNLRETFLQLYDQHHMTTVD